MQCKTGRRILITINVPLFKKLRDIIFFLRDNNFLSHFEGHFEGAKTFLTPEIARGTIYGSKKSRPPQNVLRNGSKSYCPKKKIMSQSFLNSGTLVILCLFATMGSQFYSLNHAIIRKMQIFYVFNPGNNTKNADFSVFNPGNNTKNADFLSVFCLLATNGPQFHSFLTFRSLLMICRESPAKIPVWQKIRQSIPLLI